MTGLAIGMVLLAALFHATWNLYAKKASGGPAFVWLSEITSALLFAPIAIPIIIYLQPHVGWLEILFIGGSAIFHTVYFLLLQQGYRVGDLSLVYPLARGTGPMLSTTAAVLIFGERPSLLALLGAFLIVVGVFILTGGTRLFKSHKTARWAIVYGLLTGLLIAAYTLWDKQAVSTFMLPPIFFYYFSSLCRVSFLTPLALRLRDKVRSEWKTHRKEAFVVAILSPLSYFLVLTALVFTPVSYVAPAREISILIGTVMGARLLSEGDVGRRLSATSIMLAGIIALALG
jgi:drug/metabolite transporter (DMT)-like permease